MSHSVLAVPVMAFIGVFLSAGVAGAWTGPTSTPPAGNVSAPLNVGSTGQYKAGNLGVNGYLNFGSTLGSSGYGVRDNAGTLEFKNSGGSWASLQSTIYNYCSGGGCGGSTPWTTSGSNIYYSGGNVGINTASPRSALEVNGSVKVGAGPYDGNYGTINFPSSDNDNGFFWVCTSANGCASNTWDLRLYLQDDQDDSEKFSIWGGSCSNGGCSQGTSNAIEQFHVTAAGNVWMRGGLYTSGGAQYQNNGDVYMPWDGRWLSQTINQDVRNGASPTFGNIYLNYLGDWLSNRLNQAVTTNSQPQFSRIYDDDRNYYIDSNVTSNMNSINLTGSLCLSGDCRSQWPGSGANAYWTSQAEVDTYAYANSTQCATGYVMTGFWLEAAGGGGCGNNLCLFISALCSR